MAKLQARKLPVEPYQLTEIDYAPDGEACENCGRIVHYVGVVLGQTTHKHHRIGMDCAETLTTASKFDRFNARFKQVKKIIRQLNEFSKECSVPRYKAHFEEYGNKLSCIFDAGWASVLIKIPRYQYSDHSHMIEPGEWRKLYHPVRARLAALGVLAPEIPEVLKEVWVNKMQGPKQ